MNKSTNKLVVTLPSDLEMMMVREFNAPKHLVFQAMSQPQHMKRWWGPEGTTLDCEMDFRVGGQYTMIIHKDDGSTHPFKGEFLEIIENEKLVQTFIYNVEFIRDFPAINTITLVEKDGITTCTGVIKHLTKDARDGHLQNGMEEGAAQSYSRLDVLLEVLKQS